MACANKLHQVGLALHSYDAQNGVFPRNAIFWVGPDGPLGSKSGGLWNANVLLLPYLEGKQLYNSINHGIYWQMKENTTAVNISPGQFLCPSDITPQQGRIGATNY